MKPHYLLLPASSLGIWFSFYLLTRFGDQIPFYMAFWILFVAVLLVAGVGPMLWYFLKIVYLLQKWAGIEKALVYPLAMMVLSAIFFLILPLPMGQVKQASGMELDCYIAYWVKVIGSFLYLSAIPTGFCLRRIYHSMERLNHD